MCTLLVLYTSKHIKNTILTVFMESPSFFVGAFLLCCLATSLAFLELSVNVKKIDVRLN